MKYFILTGTSRGIGEALAEQLLDENHHLLCISRTANQQLIEHANAINCRLDYFPFDLSHVNGIDGLIEAVFEVIHSAVPQAEVEAIYLINNAGMLAPVAPIELSSAEQMTENVHINLLAPMIMSSNFIKRTHNMNVDKRIMNISSASAKYLLPSQSCYSTAKSGLDTFSKSVSLEQQGKTYPVKVASVYPGMIDTDMQAQIRSASKENFPFVDQFVQIAEEGKLQTPEYTARKLLDLLFSENFGDTAVVETLGQG
ncbi:(S)-benzoin forming benzil reductase [Paenibacillus radicis (ex Gao et al. 2016)]|uniref:Short-chain dehydrogenase n=1 Tax=Paenibacillus radicis (ex Gao et al. 2016) TaxID=1737354 RepID=A0A917H686_9BACL|nr:(S)-benzoin forming benzil reductase [Paenibacillus radicis (ex Gao et al. 2016)]GGG68649.1 short-chain dehydrogenase [Paenibacillus radicis (ex Gao et al. 2016)]